MKRLIVIFILLLSLVFILSGCFDFFENVSVVDDDNPLDYTDPGDSSETLTIYTSYTTIMRIWNKETKDIEFKNFTTPADGISFKYQHGEEEGFVTNEAGIATITIGDKSNETIITPQETDLGTVTPDKMISRYETSEYFAIPLKTSEQILTLINENVEVTEHRKEYIANHPKSLIERGEGDPQDIASFLSAAFQGNRLEAGIIVYRYKRDGELVRNTITAFRDTDVPKYAYVDEGEVHAKHHGWSGEAMFQSEEKRLGIKIEDFCIFREGSTDLRDASRGWSER